MNITGTVHKIGKLQQVSETFKKRTLVVKYAENPTYPELIEFETIQDKTNLLDALKPGDEVEVHFNLRGREWTDKVGEVKYFNSLVLWRVNVTSKAQAPVNNAAPADDDDLPF